MFLIEKAKVNTTAEEGSEEEDEEGSITTIMYVPILFTINKTIGRLQSQFLGPKVPQKKIY